MLSTGIYTHVSSDSKNTKNQLWYIILILKNMKKSENWPEPPLVLCQIFHENYQFFKVFEIIGTGSSLILIIFQRIETDNLKYLKNLNGWLFKIQRTAQHWIAPL
jgi:hypothetical protein